MFLPTSRMIARGSTRLTVPGDELALATGELVEDLVALDLADALEDDLLGSLGADRPKTSPSSCSVSTTLAGLGVGLRACALLDGDLGQFVLDLLDDQSRAEHADAARLGIDADMDVLVASDATVG